MTNERTLEEAIALIRVLVAHSHEPLPRDLLEQASKFLEDFPYEPKAKLTMEEARNTICTGCGNTLYACVCPSENRQADQMCKHDDGQCHADDPCDDCPAVNRPIP
jgi:hypothetical protein